MDESFTLRWGCTERCDSKEVTAASGGDETSTFTCESRESHMLFDVPGTA